jgi:hypothetical protein
MAPGGKSGSSAFDGMGRDITKYIAPRAGSS